MNLAANLDGLVRTVGNPLCVLATVARSSQFNLYHRARPHPNPTDRHTLIIAVASASTLSALSHPLGPDTQPRSLLPLHLHASDKFPQSAAPDIPPPPPHAALTHSQACRSSHGHAHGLRDVIPAALGRSKDPTLAGPHSLVGPLQCGPAFDPVPGGPSTRAAPGP